MLWTDKAKKFLKKHWDIEELKDKQVEVINELLLGNDVIGLLPTGYGKSMCYLIPPLVTKKTIFIISPLISLMEDQKDKLYKIGISCAALHSNNKNRDEDMTNIINGKINIVYMSPEYLIKGAGLELANTLIENKKLRFLAIDESHCISSWGQDFREEYTKIKVFRELYPHVPMLAVTATATDLVCQDIAKMLKLKNPVLVKASFDRPNLHLSIQEIKKLSVSKESLVLHFIKKYPNEKIIVYINSRDQTEELARNMNKLLKGCCEAYHAGMSKNLREEIQTKFIEGDIKLIICTIAFGMGIDQKVRSVIIFGCPSSIEEYYQQIGRCGRDGSQCETVLYFDYKNLFVAKKRLEEVKVVNPALYKLKLDNLYKMVKLADINTCKRKYILEYFNESCNFFICNNCDSCCNNELIDMTDKFIPILKTTNYNKFKTIVNEIKHKYIEDIVHTSKRTKTKTSSLELLEPLNKWKYYLLKNNIDFNDLPDNLKIKIPKKFIKKINLESTELNFEDDMQKYDKYIKLL